MTLRVISGKAKGRKLKSVPGETTRPVTDRVKEALFNILAGDVTDSRWWDLFAGTGAIGIEALSRGASFVRFTDLNRAPIETINSTWITAVFPARPNSAEETRSRSYQKERMRSSNTSILRRRNIRKCGRRPSNWWMKI